VRRELPAAFTRKFGIPVEYLSGRSSEEATRLRTERRAGIYSIDVILSGIGTMANVVYREKMLDPLRPALILPDVLDRSKWKRGDLWFMDPEAQYLLRLFNHVSSDIAMNTDAIKPDEFRSAQVLLHPKWRGKIAILDPTIAGSGLGSLAPMVVQLGEEFVKKLLIDQKPVFTRTSRQLADWLARGSYAITLGLSSPYVQKLREDGFPVINVYNLPDMPGELASGNVLGLLNRAPHPNAALVFVNWVASKEGLEVYSRARLHPTTRNDIDESFVEPEQIPRPGLNYFDGSGWEYVVKMRDETRLRLKEILKR
jgi:iron(III) transport system substrate-binding protein